MPTFPDRPNTALLVIDMQTNVVAQALNRDTVIANINALVDKARKNGNPIIWVQHTDDDLASGSDGWQFAAGLAPAPSEPVIQKSFGDSFEATDLESVLTDLGVGKLIVTGAQTDQCVRSTIHGAFTRGYDTILVGDAHTTEDISEYGAPPPDQVIAHTNLYWKYHDGPGRTADVLPTAEIEFAAD